MSAALLPPLEFVSTPALVIDLDVLSVSVGQLQIAAGAKGLTVGTLSEAEVFLDAGMTDLFVAYPLVPTGAKAQRLRELHDRAQLRVGVDSAEGARLLASVVAGSGKPLKVLIECDSGEGRTGVPPSQVGDVAEAALRMGLLVAGAFTHGGHSCAGGEYRRSAADDEVTVLMIACEQLAASGCELLELSAGSTPTVELSARSPVTEQRPGTYVFNDAQQVAIGSCSPSDVAVRVVSTVVSASARQGQMIIDTSAKALAREPSPLLAGWGALPDLRGSTISDLNDYHGFVALGAGCPTPPVGSRVSVIPNHVCPVVNLFESMHIVRGRELVDEWMIDARAKSQ
jgi:D-serine deaminase-like pyridoxal phosphate-dependent protein